MDAKRFEEITSRYAKLTMVVAGDFCLDRYLEIDPAKTEVSIETGLPVHNVTRVRAQPGAAGTILNNLVALGIGTLYPVGFAGEDGEGFELCRALGQLPNVNLGGFLQTHQRRTFTYCKPLVMHPGKAPQELNRLDSKNWTPTPGPVQQHLTRRLLSIATGADAVILLDQVDVPETGVVTRAMLGAVGELQSRRTHLPILADSRRGLRDFPPVLFKMNAAELASLAGVTPDESLASIGQTAAALARQNKRAVVVTLSERGMLGAAPDGTVEHVPAWPLRGEIDVVGAGDSVSANFAAALAAGASMREALELANAAASIVVHKLGTTGTASIEELRTLLFGKTQGVATPRT